MTDISYYARAAADPRVIAEVATQLAATWDPHGEFTAPDGERTAEAHARTIVGILGTGQNEAADPTHIRLLGADAVVLQAQPRAHLIQQPRRFRPRYTLTSTCVTHTPSKVSDNASSLRARQSWGCSGST